jgi:hypothetical protein
MRKASGPSTTTVLRINSGSTDVNEPTVVVQIN